MIRLVKCLALDLGSGHDLMGDSLSLESGQLCAKCGAGLGLSVSLSARSPLMFSPPPSSLLNKINKLKKVLIMWNKKLLGAILGFVGTTNAQMIYV